MNKEISHKREEETIEAKTRWYRSLPLNQRMDILCSFTDLALSINPKIVNKKDAEQAKKGFLILSKL